MITQVGGYLDRAGQLKEAGVSKSFNGVISAYVLDLAKEHQFSVVSAI